MPRAGRPGLAVDLKHRSDVLEENLDEAATRDREQIEQQRRKMWDLLLWNVPSIDAEGLVTLSNHTGRLKAKTWG